MKARNWFWGVFLILSAVLIVASQLGSFGQIGFWSILATVALVAMMVKSLVRLNYTGILIPASLLYLIYQKPFNLVYISPWLLLLAAVLASIGLSMIFRKKPKAHYAHHYGNHKMNGYDGVQPPQMQVYENSDESNPYAKVSFGSLAKYLHSSQLYGGQFYASFGALEVYFDQSTPVAEGATLFLDCSFGTIKLYVPRHWQVIDKMQTTMAGVTNEKFSDSVEENAPKLILTGNVLLGNVEVQYV